MDPTLLSRSWSLPESCLYTCQLSSWTDVTPYFKQADLEAIQVSLTSPELQYEFGMLQRLIYKNSSQHRGSSIMRRLRLVTRQLMLLNHLQLPAAAADVAVMIKLATPLSMPISSTRSAPGMSGVKHVHRVPCQEALGELMYRIMGGCQLLQGLVVSCLEAAAQLAAQVAKSFFMPLCITAMAMLARIQALSMQQLECCISAYNRLASLLPLLPVASPSPSPSPPLSSHSLPLHIHPESLQCSIHNHLPHIIPSLSSPPPSPPSPPPPSDPSVSIPDNYKTHSSSSQQAWVQRRSAQLWDELGLIQGMDPSYVGSVRAQRHMTETMAAATTTVTTMVAVAPEQQQSVCQSLEQVGPPPGVIRSVTGEGPSERGKATGAGARAGKARLKGAGTQGLAVSKPTEKQPPAARRSFFDLISGKASTTSTTSTTSATATIPTLAPGSAFIDRGPGRTSQSQAVGAVTTAVTAGITARVPSAAATNAVPVYTTSMTLLGFGLGLQPPLSVDTAPTDATALGAVEDATLKGVHSGTNGGGTVTAEAELHEAVGTGKLIADTSNDVVGTTAPGTSTLALESKTRTPTPALVPVVLPKRQGVPSKPAARPAFVAVRAVPLSDTHAVAPAANVGGAAMPGSGADGKRQFGALEAVPVVLAVAGQGQGHEGRSGSVAAGVQPALALATSKRAQKRARVAAGGLEGQQQMGVVTAGGAGGKGAAHGVQGGSKGVGAGSGAVKSSWEELLMGAGTQGGGEGGESDSGLPLKKRKGAGSDTGKGSGSQSESQGKSGDLFDMLLGR